MEKVNWTNVLGCVGSVASIVGLIITIIVDIIMMIPTTEINIEVDLNTLNLDFLIIPSKKLKSLLISIIGDISI